MARCRSYLSGLKTSTMEKTWDWRSAFFAQARSDYELLLLLERQGAPLNQRLHYMQMCSEKLAKAFRTEPGGQPPVRKHEAFVYFVRKVAPQNSGLQAVCGFSGNRQAYQRFLREFTSEAESIENLSPEGDDHPNPEYPWESGGTIYSPTDYDFIHLDTINNPKVRKLIGFLQKCLELER